MIRTALKHPREALVWLAMGRARYNRTRLEFRYHTCPPEGRTDIHEHLPTLEMLTEELGLKRILELGVAEGESTLALLRAAKRIGGKVTSLDIVDCPNARRRVASAGLQDWWRFSIADALKVDWHETVDHLLLDTWPHSFEQTLAELQKFEPCVAQGGIITVHDLHLEGVALAIRTFSEGRSDLHAHEYLNNNGMMVIFKK